MDKQTESRSQFEAWLTCRFTFEPKPNFDRNIYSRERYVSFNTQRSWEAWQAGRESLVVAMPEKSNVMAGIDMIGMAGRSGRNKGIEESEDALRAIGIRIKGEAV